MRTGFFRSSPLKVQSYITRHPTLRPLSFKPPLQNGRLRVRVCCRFASSSTSLPGHKVHLSPTHSDISPPQHAPISSIPPRGSRDDPEAWVLLLDKFLPLHLRISVPNKVNPAQDVGEQAWKGILATISGAREPNRSYKDVLSYMVVEQKRNKAALYLMETLLKEAVDKSVVQETERHSSNILWSGSSVSLDKLCKKPIMLEATSYRTGRIVEDVVAQNVNHKVVKVELQDKHNIMSCIWGSIGSMIIESANLSDKSAQETISIVHQVLAQAHNLGLVPQSIYSYVVPPYNSTVRRPPILHLLSSRILTTLSDTAWKSQAPGGRYRLKVRQLEPEVWLEFVLWCCVEGGFAAAGTRILKHLRQQTRNPWFAIDWTSNSLGAGEKSAIDWDRVKLRTGGTVGRIEGYSTEKPFVEMPSRTISTEVVLALVETTINAINPGTPHGGTNVLRAQEWIKSIITFLEPHRRPPEYFDYLAVRLLQSGGFDGDRQSSKLQSWASILSYLRALEPVEARKVPRITFDYDSVLLHSELQAGILHQSLEAVVDNGSVPEALEIFGQIQQLVDSSKLQAIGSFLGTPLVEKNDGFFTARPFIKGSDFVNSHGQLPYYRLAAFLNMITEAKLIALGHWLLYNDEVDGPLIPRHAYALSSMAAALIKFAAASDDISLADQVLKTRSQSRLNLTVNFQRTSLNAQLMFLDFPQARRVLDTLKHAQAGGYTSTNVAYLAATLLRLEAKTSITEPEVVRTKLDEGTDLMRDILDGRYDGSKGAFTLDQRRVFMQQVGYLLRVCENIPGSIVTNLRRDFNFPLGNEAALATTAFNILLDAVVETAGAEEGRRLWELFCKESPEAMASRKILLPDDFVAPGELPSTDYDGWEPTQAMPGPKHRPMHDGYVPVVLVDDVVKHSHTDDTTQQDSLGSDTTVKPPPPQAIDISFNSNSNTTIGDNSFEQLREITTQQDVADDQPYTPNPVTTPDMRTLRIIVRGAIAEKRRLSLRNMDTSTQDDILEWSRQHYRAFGASSRLIAQETQQQQTGYEEDRLTPAEAKALGNAERRKRDIRERTPVNVAWRFYQASPVTKAVASPTRRKRKER